MSNWAGLIVSLVLIVLNAWFVLFEFALVRMRSTRLEELEDQGVTNAAAARRMHERMNDYLSACQVGITIASLAIGWLAEPAMSVVLAKIFGEGVLPHTAVVAIAFTVITMLHVVLGEQLPKAAAIQLPEKALLWSVKPMRLFYLILWLPLRFLSLLVNGVLKLSGLKVNLHEEASLSMEEIRIVVTDAYRQGGVSLDRSMLLENALDFGTIAVRDVMIPLARAQTVDVRGTWSQHIKTFNERKLSRYLLVDGGLENILGYVHIKDLALKDDEVPLLTVKRDLAKIDVGTQLEIALRELQRVRTQIALVTDGPKAVGVLTMEDLLEELVGEIHDEFEDVRVWNLAERLDVSCIVADAEAKTSEEIVRSLCGKIAALTRDVALEPALRAVLRRDSQGSTALGHDIAIPHARMPRLSRTHVGLARLATPIEWGKAGGPPVRFVFLILTPAEAPLEQNRALRKVARLVRDELLLDRLGEAPTAEAMLEVVRAADVIGPAIS